MVDYSNLVPEQLQCSDPFFGGPQLTNVCSVNSGILFLQLFNLLLASHPKIGDPCGRVEPVKRPNLFYDFIVVGAGAAGPVVAEFLSRSPNTTVLLVDAGPDVPAGTQVPSNLQLYLKTELDWNFETTNESYACLNRNGKCSWPRGKNLGGCTVHHGMAYHRGHRKDYDRWVEMGNDGWSWEEVLPFFKEAEDNREIGRVRREDHGTGGPLTVERFPWQPEFANAIMEAANEVGYGVTEDIVGEKITGFTVAQTISRDGVRLDSSDAYLKPARHRKNLHIMVNTTATKVTMSRKKATGIEYISNGRKGSVRARKEVILSAGAINSPQLLLLSGIGAKEHLESVGIRTIVDLPGVGRNLHNHASFGVDFTLSEPLQSTLTVDAANRYLYNQTGPLSSTGLAQVTGILASNYTTPDDPDIQIFFAGYQATCPTNGRIADLTTYGDHDSVRFSAVNLQTRSRGMITLQDKNPLSKPRIWSNDLAHPQDASIIIEGLHAIMTMANSTTMQKYGLKLAGEPLEACSQHPLYSDEYWRCAIHWDTRPENHQAGSCKMGPVSDRMAVVDSRLRVYGVKGLRVADASIMPQVISGNPVATIDMIGRRAGYFIKEDHGLDIQ